MILLKNKKKNKKKKGIPLKESSWLQAQATWHPGKAGWRAWGAGAASREGDPQAADTTGWTWESAFGHR